MVYSSWMHKQNAMDNPSCTSTPPETILSLLWTTVAVFGIVYAILGYRCLRAVGFLSGLAAGTGCILWLQSQQIEVIGSQADSGKESHSGHQLFHNWKWNDNHLHFLISIFIFDFIEWINSLSNGCWPLWCYTGVNTSNRCCASVCIRRCHHKRIDYHILHRNSAESCVWRKCAVFYDDRYDF